MLYTAETRELHKADTTQVSVGTKQLDQIANYLAALG